MPQNGTERPFWPICVHSCVPTVVHNSATVYTNAPKRHREAILANLCTLLRHRPGGDAHIAGAVTQPPTHTNSRSFIHKVHRCWMSAYLPLSAGCYGSDSPLLSSSSYRRTRRSACGFLGRASRGWMRCGCGRCPRSGRGRLRSRDCQGHPPRRAPPPAPAP